MRLCQHWCPGQPRPAPPGPAHPSRRGGSERLSRRPVSGVLCSLVTDKGNPEQWTPLAPMITL